MHRLNRPLVLALVALPLAAQMDRAALTGVVLDPSQSVIPGAKLSVKSVATKLEYAAVANSAGVYTLTGLPLGEYAASISANGFETPPTALVTPAKTVIVKTLP